ncbi:MAG: hypothetical protein ABI811_15580 [Acidobacteriota bacterium]
MRTPPDRAAPCHPPRAKSKSWLAFSTPSASGAIWTLEEFHEFGSSGARKLDSKDLAAIRKRRGELFQQWFAVLAGGVLELSF